MHGLFTSSLGSRNVHLTKPLVSLIALSFDHQNHSKWQKWCHDRYSHVTRKKIGHPIGPSNGQGNGLRRRCARPLVPPRSRRPGRDAPPLLPPRSSGAMRRGRASLRPASGGGEAGGARADGGRVEQRHATGDCAEQGRTTARGLARAARSPSERRSASSAALTPLPFLTKSVLTRSVSWRRLTSPTLPALEVSATEQCIYGKWIWLK